MTSKQEKAPADEKGAAKARDDQNDNSASVEHDFQDTLQEEFHKVWDETIKPALEQLKSTTEDVLKHFSDFEDDFRGYLRDREPDVDVELLEEIYGDTLRRNGKKNEEEKTASEDRKPDEN